MAVSKSNEIRTSWKSRWAGRVGGWGIRLLGVTLRRELGGAVKELNASAEPLIHLLWHNRILVSPYLFRKVYPKREVVVLTSASKDGAVLAAAVKVFRVGAVHGSSSRRGAAALVALRRATKNGKDLVFTPDGPRGPRYELQPGVVKIAQTTGLAIVPLHINYLSYWTLKTWDGFRIPKPFSKVQVTLGDPITIPRDLDDEGFERERAALEQILSKNNNDPIEK